MLTTGRTEPALRMSICFTAQASFTGSRERSSLQPISRPTGLPSTPGGRGAFDNIVPMINVYPGMWLGYHPAMADFVMGYYNGASPDADIQTTTVENLDERAGGIVDDILESVHAHRHGRDGATPDWGVATATGRQADMIYQRLQIGGLTGVQAQVYLNAMSLLADYVLGCNPPSYTYITGLGSRRPEEPVHTDSLAFIKDAGMPPMPGIRKSVKTQSGASLSNKANASSPSAASRVAIPSF